MMSMRLTNQHRLIPWMTAAACCLVGCSGGEPAAPPAPPPSVTKAPPRPNVIRQEQPAESRRAADSRQSTTPAHSDSRRPLPPGVDPDDVFLALAEPKGNFTIVANSDGTKPDDWFVAASPAPGADSRTFQIVPPRDGSIRSTSRGSLSLPEGFTAVETAGLTKDGWPQRISCEADDSLMAFVPGGVFLCGYNGESENSLPAHPVELDPYYIDVTEVTLRQYDDFIDGVRDDGRLIPPPANDGASDEHPALGIEWGEAARYARWAGKSLPTEAEWELAARGPDSFVCPWGNGRAVWDGHREPGQIDAVGTFSTDRSVFGVMDMSGNAREWVLDNFGEVEAPTTGGTSVKNPSGPRRASISNHRVVKGGGPQWELWHRSSASMSSPTPDLGFRCVLRVTRDGNRVGTRTLDGEAKDDGSPTRTRSRRRSERRPASGL